MLMFVGKREDNQKQKRDRIVAAAKALFSKQGYDATNTRQIAKRARVAHGTLFLYAKTRADVVGLVFESEIGAALTKALAAAPDHHASLTALCMHFYGAFIDVYARDPALARVLVKELPWLEGRMRAVMQGLTFDVLGAVATQVAARQQAGNMRDDVVGAVYAAATFSLYYGALTAWLSAELGDPAGEGKGAALFFLRGGLELLEKGAAP